WYKKTQSSFIIKVPTTNKKELLHHDKYYIIYTQIKDPHIDFVDASAEKTQRQIYDGYRYHINLYARFLPTLACQNMTFNIDKNRTRRSWYYAAAYLRLNVLS